jgi:hypothetical protein
MKLVKKGLLLPAVLSAAFALAGCANSDDVTEAILGTVNISGNIVDASANDVALDVSIKATTNGLPASRVYDSSTATTDASGNFSLTVAKDLPVYFHMTKAGYTTFNSAIDSYSSDRSVSDVPIFTVADAESIIDLAFPTSGLNLGDKAWLIVEVLDASGDDLAGVTVAQSSLPTEWAYNNQNTCVNDYDTGAGPTADCTATRVGPMYIAYYDAEEVIDVSITGAASGTQAALVRMGEVAVVVFQQ